MNPIEEIKRRIELKQQLIKVTNAEIDGLCEALIVVKFADSDFLQLVAGSTCDSTTHISEKRWVKV